MTDLIRKTKNSFHCLRMKIMLVKWYVEDFINGRT